MESFKFEKENNNQAYEFVEFLVLYLSLLTVAEESCKSLTQVSFIVGFQNIFGNEELQVLVNLFEIALVLLKNI